MIWRMLPRDLQDAIAGDLVEEYHGVVRRRGRIAAAAWFWWSALRLVVAFRWERAIHGRALPPIADEPALRLSGLETVGQDLRFAARMLRRHRAFAAAAIAALAVGVGATTAVFSVVDAVLWRALPYPQPDGVVMVLEQRPHEGRVNGPVSPADFLDWRASSRSFSSMATVTEFALNLTGRVEPQRLNALAVSPGFFEALGVPPIAGRPFRIEEEELGRSHVAILTDGLWRRAFGARPDMVGTQISLNAEPYVVVGILPSSFWWTTRPDVIVPRAFEPEERTWRGLHMFPVVARLAPGVTLERARAEMDTIGKRLAEAYPVENRYHSPQVTPIRDVLVGSMRQPLLVLLGAAVLLLLIACANVSTLMVARATTRRAEIAVRLTLGAARGRLVRQLLTESAFIAAIGGAVGVLVAFWLVAAATAIMPARMLALPGIDRIAVDVRVLVAAMAVTAATVLLFGLVPAATASAEAASDALAEAGRSGTGNRRTRRVRALLVVGELALATMLLVGAGLLIVSFQRLLDIPTGFDAEGLVTMRVTLPAAKYGRHAEVVRFYEALLDRLRATPGVSSAGLVTLPPFGGENSRGNFLIERPAVEYPFPVRARQIAVSPDYARTLHIQLRKGRFLAQTDTDGAKLVAVLNETAARRYWPQGNAVGQRISFEFDKPQWIEIVGIVSDVKSRALDVETEPEAYLSYYQPDAVGSVRAMTAMVRTPLPLSAAAPLLRAAVAALDRDQPVGPIRTMDDLVADSVAPRRLNLWLLVGFAFVALLLTAHGLYGVMAYLAVQRTREIGIRVALGATRAAVLRMMLNDAARMTIAGIGSGVVLALLLARSLASLLFGVSPTDPVIYIGVAFVLAVVAFGAVAIPSSRAAGTDPLSALREP